MKKYIITSFLCGLAMILGAQVTTVIGTLQQQGRAVTSSAVWGEIIGLVTDQADLMALFDDKQDNLVSGTSIKTVNSNSLLGSGNLAVQDVLVSGTNIKTINSSSILGSGNLSVAVSDGDKTGVQVSGSGATWTVKKFGTIYDVTQYGLVGDNSTDNSSALTSLIAAVSANSTFYFPVGSYRFTTSVVFSKTIHIIGDGDDSILRTSANITLLDFDAGGSTPIQGVRIENVYILNDNGSTPSSAAIGLRMDIPFQPKVRGVAIHNFYKNVQLISVVDDVWDDFSCSGWVHTGMERINNAPYKDSGDGSISNSRFFPYGRNATYSIFHQNGGGLKIVNTKFNYDSSGPFKAQYHYYYDADGSTVDIQIANNSFENYSEGALYFKETSGNIREISIVGNDIGATSSTGVEGVTLNGIDIAVISGNTFKGGSGSSTAIALIDTDNVVECGNVFSAWTNDVTQSGTVTNFKQCQY